MEATEGQRLGRLVASAVAVTLTGCAMTPQFFYANKQTLSDSRVCRTWAAAVEANASVSFIFDVSAEADRRGLSASDCADKVSKENVAAAATVLVILGVAAAAAARRGGGAAAPVMAQQDYSWEWDEFYDQSRQLVWACRGVQTGEFAATWHCGGKVRSDWKWPGK